MVSDYLNQFLSVEELDEILEHEREVAVSVAQTVFNHEVSTAISNIGEINQVASARILADSQIASAKMMSDAEVIATLMASKAEIAAIEVRQKMLNSPIHSATGQGMIFKICQDANAFISQTANESIKAIEREAQEAIAKLKENATQAIDKIHALAEEVAEKIDQNANIAKELLNKQKLQPRTPQEVIKSADEQAQKILDEATRSSVELKKIRDTAISEITAFVEHNTSQIRNAALASERRIAEARDKAMERINGIVSQMLPH